MINRSLMFYLDLCILGHCLREQDVVTEIFNCDKNLFECSAYFLALSLDCGIVLSEHAAGRRGSFS